MKASSEIACSRAASQTMMLSMGMVTPPGHEVFSAADLAPPEWVRREQRRSRIERTAAFVAMLALGLWAGGLVALGACAAPMVFGLTPFPYSADAMGAAFARFDALAVGCAVTALAAEVTRTVLELRHSATRRERLFNRARRYVAMLAAGLAIVSGTQFTPEIQALHRAGVRRNVGTEGARLSAVHNRAETAGKAEVLACILAMALHLATVRSQRDDDENALTPLPPGPNS